MRVIDDVLDNGNQSKGSSVGGVVIIWLASSCLMSAIDGDVRAFKLL